MSRLLHHFPTLVLLHFSNAQNFNLPFPPPPTVQCGVLVAVPFGDGRSLNGVAHLSNGTTAFKSQNLAQDGYGLMAAALLAIDHFNDRNDSIVRELDSLLNCSFRFPLDLIQIMDSNRSPTSTFRGLFEVQPPCVVIGPLDDNAAAVMQLELQAVNIPGITYAARSFVVANPAVAPQMVRGTIGLKQYSDAVVSYLQRQGKERDYVATLVNGGSGSDLANVLELSANHVGLNVVQQLNVAPDPSPGKFSAPLLAILHSGVRTIIVGLIRDDDLEQLANTAGELGMLSNEFFWVFLDQTLPPEYIMEYRLQESSPLARLLHGSAIIKLLDGFEWISEDRFLQTWTSLNASFVKRLNGMYPSTSAVQFRGTTSYFRTKRPPTYSTFVYDAVISAGLGKCHAEATMMSLRPPLVGSSIPPSEPPGGLTQGWVHSIITANFSGASGRVSFDFPSSRDLAGVGIGVFNILSTGANSSTSQVQFKAVLTDIMVENIWTTTDEPFIFRDGTSNQPTPLRVIKDNNYLPTGIRVTGLFFMAVAQALTVACGLFVWIHRKQRVLTASQPEFLYMLCFGSFIFTCSILTHSFDEGLGLNQASLDALCMTTPWLIFVGDSVIYMALFSKPWRVQKVLQFRRAQKVRVASVIGPFIVCEMSVLAVMTTWQIASPQRWIRITLEGSPPHTVGQCKSDHGAAFMASLAGIIIVITLLAAWMSWKTRDVPADISDSSRVWYTILTHLQSIIVGLPILYILNGKSPNGMYLCFALLVSTITITSMSFLIVPKMYNLWELRLHGDTSQRRTVWISGFSGADRRPSMTTNVTSGNTEAQLNGLDEKIRLLEIQREQLRSSMSSPNDRGERQEEPLQSCKTTSVSDGASNRSSKSLQADEVVNDVRDLESAAANPESSLIQV